MRPRRTSVGSLAAAVAVALAGLAAEAFLASRAAAADESIRFHNWWNYYERGVQRLAAGDAAAAAEDFERCLDLRPGAKFGYPRDMWRARTYGLHFLENYFPHREYGICLYLLGENEKAVGYLEKSLAQEPSGRAKHYLNLARARLLKSSAPAPPVVVLDAACEGTWVRDRQREVRGTVRGEGYVSEISINGKRQFFELAAREVGFREVVPLRPGENRVRVMARDLAGQEAVRDVRFIADWRPPEFVILKAVREGGGWTLTASCEDDLALAEVRVDGEPRFARTAGGAAEQAARLEVTLAAGQSTILKARDMAGNEAWIVLSEETLSHAWLRAAGVYASAGEAGVPDAGAPAAAEAVDQMKPSIALSVGRDVSEVVADEFFLDGSASDGGGLASVRLNGEEMLAAEHRGALRRHFARRIPLELGTNTFTVTAEDLAGNRHSKSFAVVRRTPDYLKAEFRLSMGVPPLVGPAGTEDPMAVQIKNAIEMALLSEPVRFHLLERDEGWDFILREQELSLSDLADPKAALRIGKMLPAELLLMGSLLRQGSGLTIYAKIVETGDGQVLFSEDVYTEGDREDLAYQVDGLVMKIEQRFPLVEGQVVSLSGKAATIDAGLERGVDVGSSFIVIARPPNGGDIALGQVREVAGTPVRLSITRARRGQSVAQVLPAEAVGVVETGDWVYAR